MDVVTERAGPILICTLNRPDQHNSLTTAVFAGLLAAFQEADRDDAIRVVVTKAKGASFSVGADASDLETFPGRPLADCFHSGFEGEQGLPGVGGPIAQALDPLGVGRWAEAVAEIAVPLIAQIQGPAAGGGLAVAMLHHFRFASSRAKFSTAFSRLGLGSEMGLTYLLQSTIGRQASLDLQLTGRLVDAAEALTLGLVDQVHPPDELDTATMEYAERIAANSPYSTRSIVQAHRAPHRTPFREALLLEWMQQKVLWDSEHFQQGVDNFLRGRAAAKRT